MPLCRLTARPPSSRLMVCALALAAFLGAPCCGRSAFAASVVEVPSISSRTERLLAQADALLEDSQWEDAVETLTLLQGEAADQLVTLPDARHVPLRDVIQARFCRLPPEVLSEHRRRIDPAAERLLDQGRATRDARSLRGVIDEYFVSSATPDAALLLADLAIERGDFNAARGAIQELHPLLTDPLGRPVGIALAGIPLRANWEQIEQILRARPDPSQPVYPDADDRLPAALARLALISLLELDLERAAIETELLSIVAPDAEGRLAGAEGPVLVRLQGLLDDARLWPAASPPRGAATLNGSVTREGLAAPVGELAGAIWRMPLGKGAAQADEAQQQGTQIVELNGRLIIQGVQADVSSGQAGPSALPVVYGDWLIVRDAGTLIARDLATGLPAVSKEGVIARSETRSIGGTTIRLQAGQALQIIRMIGPTGGVQPVEGPLHVDQGVLYARLPSDGVTLSNAISPQTKPAPRVVGFSLDREGLQVADMQSPEAPWSFSGPPIVEAGQAYLALQADEVRPRVAVACYSTATGKQLWLTPVGSGPPASGTSAPRPADVLAKQGGVLYFNTNFGAVAAIAAADGQLRWVAEYPRIAAAPALVAPSPGASAAGSPCVMYRGRVLAAPVDSASVFALDPATGRRLWAAAKAGAADQLLGARDDTLVSGGDLLTGYDIDTGARRYQWPHSARSGIRGMGRGCLAGDEVFWPTRNAIYARDARTGEATRPPIDLAPLGGEGANLTAANGVLIVAAKDRLTVLGPNPPAPPPPAPRVTTHRPLGLRSGLPSGGAADAVR